MFDLLVHADWSLHPRGRWAATARRNGSGWRVTSPVPVGDIRMFREQLIVDGRSAPVLAGFDFPIGVPSAYGVQTGFAGFREALLAFGTADGWQAFYTPAATPDEIALRRPFFPAGSGAGAKQAHVAQALGLADTNALLRTCERGGAGRRRASPLFWTVGAAQVGRAATVGWREVIAPALAAGAALWPFDGSLDQLSSGPGLVLAETYPADAYGLVGAPFGPRESKRNQGNRAARAAVLIRWAAAASVDISDCEGALKDGFGPERTGEDRFDALLGLLAMIAVVDGRQPETSCRCGADTLVWEGWILGR